MLRHARWQTHQNRRGSGAVTAAASSSPAAAAATAAASSSPAAAAATAAVSSSDSDSHHLQQAYHQSWIFIPEIALLQ